MGGGGCLGGAGLAVVVCHGPPTTSPTCTTSPSHPLHVAPPAAHYTAAMADATSTKEGRVPSATLAPDAARQDGSGPGARPAAGIVAVPFFHPTPGEGLSERLACPRLAVAWPSLISTAQKRNTDAQRRVSGEAPPR
ncbi:hypothetical protein BS50DRAFT_653388 [Corynespora cassiicola Philippines]|uniref:Uncharacterized protein n=1 Tax=Corynespora cassiicola Philippines TaxID=1448308 RepID=A0A2T2P5V6_CORCC|nr:hypothetical protein BS50DRAFT_653388 [Corynespora cassiicola Philippines]